MKLRETQLRRRLDKLRGVPVFDPKRGKSRVIRLELKGIDDEIAERIKVVDDHRDKVTSALDDKEKLLKETELSLSGREKDIQNYHNSVKMEKASYETLKHNFKSDLMDLKTKVNTLIDSAFKNIEG